MPAFDITGGLGTAIVRGLSLAACLSVLGITVFRLVVAPPAFASMQAEAAARLDRRCLGLLWASAVAALLGSGLWLVLEAGDMIGASTIGDSLAAVPLVIRHSRFGQVILLRLVLLAAVPVVSGKRVEKPRLVVAAVLAAVASAAQAAFGHGASMGGAMEWLGLSTVLHVLAAGIWLGQLLPLWMVVSQAPPAPAGIALRRFSPLGLVCVLVLAFTASAQGLALTGGIGGLFGTAYGWTDLAKLLLFAALLGLAASNRFALMPKLAADSSTIVRQRLSRSVLGEVILGLLVILVAGLLTSLPPGMHQQALWPFDWRPSLVALSEPELRQEIVGAGALAAGAVVLAGVAVALRRLLWAAAVIAIVLLGLVTPHFRPLFVEAYPTSYFVSPSGFTASGIAHGADLFKANCVSCHGDLGRGDGPKAKSLAVPPADLTAEHLWEHADGELFWWLSHGIEGPDGKLVMPGFAANLSEGDRWDLIDFIRANNAGQAFRAMGHWHRPVAAPDFEAECGGKGTVRLSEMRGQVVYLAATSVPTESGPFPNEGLTRVLISPRPAESPEGCVTTDPAVWNAFAIVAGTSPQNFDGSRFLVDAAGWLRKRWQPGNRPDWNDPAALATLVDDIRSHPIGQSVGQGHHHH